MEDKDSLYFSFDDEQADDDEGGAEEEAKAEEGQNRTFLIGAIALAAVFVLGICAVIAYIFFLRPQQAGTNDPGGIAATNAVLETQSAQTAEANALTQSAPTDVPPTTAAPKGSATPTSGVSVSVVPGGSATPGTPGTPGTGAPATTGTPGTAGPTNTPGGIIEVTGSGTQVAQVNSPTPSGLGGAPGTPTATPTRGNSGIIIVTPLGGGGGVVSTPTRIAGQVDGSPTGVGGPIQPTTPGSLPNTGFTGGVGLAGAGLLAVVLVVVVVIARKIRMQ